MAQPLPTQSASQPPWPRLAWLTLAGLGLLLFTLALPARYAQLARPAVAALPAGWTPATLSAALASINWNTADFAAYRVAAEAVLGLGLFITAAIIAWRRPLYRPALYAALTLLFAGLGLLPVLPALAGQWPAGQGLALALQATALLLLAGLLYLFPDGRWVPRWTRWLLSLWAGYLFAAVYFPALAPPLQAGTVRDSREAVLLAGTLAWLAGSALALVYRLRHETNDLRRQPVKWLLLGLGIAGLGSAWVQWPLWLVPAERLASSMSAFYLLAAIPLTTLCLLAWPLGLALGSLRRGLWDVDFVANRVLVYAGVLAVLSLTFWGLLFVLATWLPPEPVLTFAVSAGLAGLLFRPVRHRMRHLVDRHFYGIRLDYRARAETDEAFSQTRLGQYTRLEPVRLGSAGIAYRAQHPSLGRSVVVKVLPRRFTAEPQARELLKAATHLQHPNLARVYEAGEEGGRLYAVTEYLVGQDLNSFLLINGRLALDRALPILQDVASALDYAHGCGHVHGDVRLVNVLLVLRDPEQIARDARFTARAAFLPTTAFRTVLLNFGLAQALGTGCGVEALAYAAPEKIRGERSDGRADLYAFGALAYLLLAGALPFQQPHPAALAIAHLRQAPPDPRGRVRNLSPAIAAALLRALAKDPAERFQTASEFVRALAAATAPPGNATPTS